MVMARSNPHPKGSVPVRGSVGLVLLGLFVMFGLVWWALDGPRAAGTHAGLENESVSQESSGVPAGDSQLAGQAPESSTRTSAADPDPVPVDQALAVDWGAATLGTWHGTVLASRTGQPLEGARIEARFAQGSVATQSDAQGGFVLEVPLGEGCDLIASKPGYTARAKPRATSGEALTLLLVQAASLLGEFSGGPPEVQAFLYGAGPNVTFSELAKVPLDPQGAFRFDGLEAGVYSIRLGPGVYAVAKDIAVTAGEQVRVSLQTCESTAPLEGRVLWQDDETPVEGVRVEATYHALGMPTYLEVGTGAQATSDSSGRFTIPMARGMRTGLRLLPPGGAPIEEPYLDLVDWEAKSPWVWHLARPARLGGVVQDPTGKPVAGCVVECVWTPPRRNRGSRSGGAHPTWTAETDGKGHFEFPSLPSGADLWVQVAGAKDGQAAGRSAASPRTRVQLAAGEARMDLVLTSGWQGRLFGTITDSFQTPWAGLHLQLRGDWGKVLGEGWTESDGSYRIEGFATYPNAGLVLRFESDGDAVAARNFRMDADVGAGSGDPDNLLVLEKDFELERLRVVRGWVLDPEGYAVGGARVRVRGESSRDLATDRSDPTGSFALRAAWPESGEVVMRVERAGWKLSGAKELTMGLPLPEPLILTMEPDFRGAPASVQGEVLLADTQDPMPRLRFEGLQGGVLTTSGTRFQIQGLRPGRFRARIRTPGFEYVDLPPVDLSPGAKMDLGVVRVWPGTTFALQVRGIPDSGLPKGSLARLEYLSDPADRPELKGRRIALRATGASKGTAEFQSAGIPRGRWRLLVRIPGYKDIRREVRFDGARESLRLTVRR